MLFTSKRRLHLLDFRSVEHILMQKKLKVIENHRNTISQKQHSSKKSEFPLLLVLFRRNIFEQTVEVLALKVIYLVLQGHLQIWTEHSPNLIF